MRTSLMAGLRLSKIIAAILLGGATLTAAGQENDDAHSLGLRETLSLDQGWRFHLGDIPPTDFRPNRDEAEGGAKAGGAWGAAAPNYDDKSWRELDLPHDWVVEGPFDQEANRNQGYRRRGIAWYRRQFELNESDRGKHIELQFDGVSTHCTVWFNGMPVHHNWNGYASFYIDITSMARYGNDINTIAVRVDAKAMEGWWYEGAGIYRHTWLVKRNPVHIVTDGIYANPVRSPDGHWTIPVEATLRNSGYRATSALLTVSVIDPSGKDIARANTPPVDLAAFEQQVETLSLPVESPRIWSVDEPILYEVRTTVLNNNLPVDAVTTKCGFRMLRFDQEQGFLLNEQRLVLQGVCNHQDHAGVGVAVPDSLWEFRIRKLKEMARTLFGAPQSPGQRASRRLRPPGDAGDG